MRESGTPARMRASASYLTNWISARKKINIWRCTHILNQDKPHDILMHYDSVVTSSTYDNYNTTHHDSLSTIHRHLHMHITEMLVEQVNISIHVHQFVSSSNSSPDLELNSSRSPSILSWSVCYSLECVLLVTGMCVVILSIRPVSSLSSML